MREEHHKPWFKFYGQEFLTDMKMRRLSVPQRLAWVTLLCLAAAEGKGGAIRFCTEDSLKSCMGVTWPSDDTVWDDLTGCLDEFERLQMIEKCEDTIFIKNFEKRQNSNFTDAEKQARYRGKKAQKVTNVTSPQVTNVTLEERRGEESRYKDIRDVFEHFCLRTGKILTLNDSRRKSLLRRLREGFTVDQLKQAVDNFIQDDWPDRYRFLDIRYCFDVIKGVDNLEKWLQTKPKEESRGDDL